MKFFLAIMVIGIAAVARAPAAGAQPVDVPKTNPMKVYMHYMPWFETPATQGANNWGLHWPMATQNPNIMDATGKRQIASHFYPMIGPYASQDPDVIEYHLLLMKYSGVDGVLIDWYGSQGANGDVGSLLTNSNALVDKTDDFGMKFGVVLEDNFSTVDNSENSPPDISKAIANVAYLKDYYFNRPAYIRLGVGNDPLLGVFGPQTFTPPQDSPAQWTQILAAAGEDVNFLPLWYRKGDVGNSNADGEFAWVYQDASTTNHLSHTTNFYTGRANGLNIAGGAAYPGFDDYYQEGGWGNNLFEIPSNNGQTLQQTLNLANQYSSRIDFLQLVTWNDFGEGTMLEPTVEHGFDYLKQIQQFTGVPYDEDELQLIYRLYMARKKYAGDAPIDAMLDQVSTLLTELEIENAAALLDSVAPAGDYDSDGDVDTADYNSWRAAYGNQTILHGSGADGNYDGIIDAADYTIWRNSLGQTGTGPVADGDGSSTIDLGDYDLWRAHFGQRAGSGSGASANAAVPEPATLELLMFAVAGWCLRRGRAA